MHATFRALVKKLRTEATTMNIVASSKNRYTIRAGSVDFFFKLKWDKLQI